jgi:hypothetical protein
VEELVVDVAGGDVRNNPSFCAHFFNLCMLFDKKLAKYTCSMKVSHRSDTYLQSIFEQ